MCILFRGLLDMLLKITEVGFNILMVLPLANHRNELSYPCNKCPAGRPWTCLSHCVMVIDMSSIGSKLSDI